MKQFKIFLGVVVCSIGFLNADVSTELPLFTKYPALKASLGYVKLGNFPTPIKKLETLGGMIGANHLYLKDDGATGTDVSGLTFGGNKVRKLEFVLGDALKNNADAVIAMGDAGSNCTTAIAAYCKKLGLKCINMHDPQLVTGYLRRNLLLSKYLGAELHWYPSTAERDAQVAIMRADYLAKNGKELYYIPGGASTKYGAIGFINAAFELNQQIKQGLIKEPDYIYVALASTGTAIGLTIGLALLGLKTKVIPILVQPETYPGQEHDRYALLYNETYQLLHSIDATIPALSITGAQVEMYHDFIGADYASITPEATLAIQLLQQCENIKLDGSYAGKAFAAMLSDIAYKNIKEKVILFWDTYCAGEFSGITSLVDYKTLPAEYHKYFECALQADDQGV